MIDFDGISRSMLEQEHDYGVNDCLTWVELCANVQRPEWARTDAESAARIEARRSHGGQRGSVVKYFDELPQFRRVQDDPQVGDIVITPQDQDFSFNAGKNVCPAGRCWMIGIIDPSFRAVAYNSGRFVNFQPMGQRWRRVEQ